MAQAEAPAFQIQGLGIKWFAAGAREKLDLGFEAEVQKLRLVISAGEGDGFLQQVLSGVKVEAEADVALGMTLLSGFTFRGGAKLAIEVGTHVVLGPIEIDGLRFALGPSSDQITLEAGAVVKFDLGPLQAVVEDIGLRAAIQFRPGNLGPMDFSVGFKPPRVSACRSMPAVSKAAAS